MKIERCRGGELLHRTGNATIELLNGKTIQISKTRGLDSPFMQAIRQVNQEKEAKIHSLEAGKRL